MMTPIVFLPPMPLELVRESHGVRFQVGSQTKSITFLTPNIVRVNTHRGQDYSNNPSFSVCAKPQTVKIAVKRRGNGWRVASSHLTLDISKTGAVTFRRPDGTVINQESDTTQPQITVRNYGGAPTYEVEQTFRLTPKESIYGLGQYDRPTMDYRGKEVSLVQTNIGIVVPFLISTQRYGILWDSASKSTFRDDAKGAHWWSESSPAGIDYYLVAGKEMDDVIRGYRTLTGAAPLFPRAAFGLFMSKERYATQQQLIDVTRKFREEKFPLDYIVQDWQYWGGEDGSWSGMIWDPVRYPDPKGLTQTLHEELHVKLMNSIWPSVGNDTELAKNLDKKGLRFAPLHWISRKARIYDAFSAEGRQIYFDAIKKGLLDTGVDALWMDGTEVEVGGACHNPNEVERDIKGLGKNAAGDFYRNLNNYSLLTTRGTYEGQRKTRSQRALTLTRSAWAGQQRYAALPWSGDTTSSWQTLHEQITGGLNVAMAGLPYWTQDTGGFFVNYSGGTSNPEYRELFNRWHQFAIFNPVYRIHGTNIDREPYRFKTMDPEVYASLREAATLRYRMLPYLYSLGWASYRDGYTMMRALPMDFPDDLQARKIDDTYMFGPAFLVHPVTQAIFRAPQPAPSTIPAENLRTESDQPGLDLEYFEGRNFDRSVSRTVDTKIDHDWPAPPLAEPPAGLPSVENFSARWTGRLIAPEDGTYEIGAEGDDGYRVYVDGKLVAEDWRDAAKRYAGGLVTLRKGQNVPIRVDYYQGGRECSLRLAWRTPSEREAAAKKKPQIPLLRTYLPAGKWVDFWTQKSVTGGRWVTTPSAMNRFPLFVRAGSILPLGPSVQYATEKLDAPIEIRVYPGRNATFDLYEDDNETYAYEKGQRSLIPFRWDDRSRKLTIGKRQGSFPGMISRRTFRIVVMGATGSAPRTVKYNGVPVTVSIPL